MPVRRTASNGSENGLQGVQQFHTPVTLTLTTGGSGAACALRYRSRGPYRPDQWVLERRHQTRRRV
jgi:hypothetical protein